MIFPSTLRGGVEEYNLKITSGAIKEHWDVHVAFPKTEGTASLIQDFTAQGAHYHQIEIAEEHVCSLLRLGRHLLWFARTVYLLLKVKPDVVQITLPYPSFCFGSIVACGFLQIPTAVRFALVPPSFMPINPWRIKAYAWARKKNQQWITISENNRKLICELFQVPKQEVICIYNGTTRLTTESENRDALRLQIRQELGLLETDLLALTVGRLHAQKGYSDLIPVIPHIVKEFAHVKFLWVGEGEQREQLMNLVQEYGVVENVLFLGYRSDVPKLLKAADLFVFPTHFEGGQSFAIAEAMVYGLPIITSAASGIPEVIKNKLHGVIFRTGDSCDLLEAIRWALKHPEKMQVMAQNAQLRAQDFSEAKMIQQYIEVWQQLGHPSKLASAFS